MTGLEEARPMGVQAPLLDGPSRGYDYKEQARRFFCYGTS